MVACAGGHLFCKVGPDSLSEPELETYLECLKSDPDPFLFQLKPTIPENGDLSHRNLK
jgi:hypothetical protein